MAPGINWGQFNTIKKAWPVWAGRHKFKSSPPLVCCLTLASYLPFLTFISFFYKMRIMTPNLQDGFDSSRVYNVCKKVHDSHLIFNKY